MLVDNPNVGENMQDHTISCQSIEVNPGIPSSDVIRDPDVLNVLMQQFHDGGRGPLGQSNSSVACSSRADGEGVFPEEAKKKFLAPYSKHAQTPDGKVVRKLLEGLTSQQPSIFAFPGRFTPSIIHTALLIIFC